jgi:hypothetical protein
VEALSLAHSCSLANLQKRCGADPTTTCDTVLLAALAGQLTAWECATLAKPFALDDLLAAVQDCPATRAPVRADAVRRDPR